MVVAGHYVEEEQQVLDLEQVVQGMEMLVQAQDLHFLHLQVYLKVNHQYQETRAYVAALELMQTRRSLRPNPKTKTKSNVNKSFIKYI